MRRPPMSTDTTPEAVRETVRAKYAERARQVSEGSAASSCCGDGPVSCCGGESRSPITSNLYGDDEVALLPEDAVKASLGCGNPTALASLAPGEVVLDLGSGGGIDVLLSARRGGPSGFAYRLDITDEMLALGRQNAAEHGGQHVEVLEG